jgi:flagellar protein FliO/FliZ
LYLGGEKLNRLYVFLAAFFVYAGALTGSPVPLSAQTPDSPEAPELPSGGVPDGDEGGAVQSEESLIILEEAPPGEPMAVPGGTGVSLVLRMVVVLALAALAIYGLIFLFKRLIRPREQRDPHLKVLSRVSLGPNRSVYVISVGSKAWLVGAGEGGVSLIAEISDQEAVDAMLLDEASRKSAESIRGQFPDFGTFLRRLAGGSLPDKGRAGPENVRKRRERLKDL